jgi:hypothetical protein
MEKIKYPCRSGLVGINSVVINTTTAQLPPINKSRKIKKPESWKQNFAEIIPREIVDSSLGSKIAKGFALIFGKILLHK